LERGKRIRACLQQEEHQLVPVDAQIALLQALLSGKFDAIALRDIPAAEQTLYDELAALEKQDKPHAR
jgi:F-type H+-transporting ATPase subunit alpha